MLHLIMTRASIDILVAEVRSYGDQKSDHVIFLTADRFMWVHKKALRRNVSEMNDAMN